MPSVNSSTELVWEGEVPLEQVLQHCSPRYGETWQGVADNLQSDPIENAIVDTLINESMETGLFEEPVYIFINAPHAIEDCEDPEDHAEYCVDAGQPAVYSVNNGTHRIVAAITAAYPTIRVTTDPNSAWDGGLLIAEFDVESVEGMTTCADCDRPDECFAFCVLRSFRLTPDVWAEQGLGSGQSGTWKAYYELPEEHLATLETKITELASQYGVTLKNLKVTYEKEEDYE